MKVRLLVDSELRGRPFTESSAGNAPTRDAIDSRYGVPN